MARLRYSTSLRMSETIEKYEKIIDSLRELIRQKDSVIVDKEKIIMGYERFIRQNLKEIKVKND
jgi:hypothetical protein